jgi:ATP-binding cassette, subfamily B, bacterial CvaB/MchF/RaxB
MLIIDEGTNEIDPDTERSIYEHLRRLGVSLLVIAHRWETLRLADRTLVLEGGRLQEVVGSNQGRLVKARECG